MGTHWACSRNRRKFSVVGACGMTGTGERELLGDIGRACKILSALECIKHLNMTDFK